MIVELFGPPGAGKITFAYALDRRLREEDYVVETVFSNRPAEKATSSGAIGSHRRTSSFFRGLMRPEIFNVVRDLGIWNEASTKLIALATLHEMLRKLEREVISISSLDSTSLSHGVAIIQQKADEITNFTKKRINNWRQAKI